MKDSANFEHRFETTEKGGKKKVKITSSKSNAEQKTAEKLNHEKGIKFILVKKMSSIRTQ